MIKRATIHRLLSLALGLGILPMAEAAEMPSHVTIPVSQTTLSDGTTRYAVQIAVNRRPIVVGLDTGSMGLRLLPAAHAMLTPSGQPNQETFGSGVILKGVVATADVTLGDDSGPMSLQKVEEIGCTEARENCGARLGIDQFRLMGDGLPGEGFVGILGIRPVPRGPIANPFAQLGGTRWIVHLPRPGDTEPGYIVINPSPAETAGFQPMPAGATPGQMLGCLRFAAVHPNPFCAPLMLDTGAPGITLVNSAVDPMIGHQVPAELTFGNEAKGSLRMSLILNNGHPATRLRTVDRPNVAGPQILAGVVPYFAFDVLYDFDKGLVALRPRQAGAGRVDDRPAP